MTTLTPARPKKLLCKIITNREIAEDIYEMVIEGDFPVDQFYPGVFVHVKCSDASVPLLRRPISICNVSDNGTQLTMLYRAEGAGTKLLAKKLSNQVLDILGPLGRGFQIEEADFKDKKVLVVGGGIGVPPLYYLGRKLLAKSANLHFVNGFNSAANCFYHDEFKKLSENTYYCTVDGTSGFKGFVTDVIKSENLADYDYLYACGPNPMLKALQDMFQEKPNSYISVEERMGCGIGACLACVCDYQQPELEEKAYARVCTEGPVFSLNKIKL
jgi:dihydroorotate dehydrogenase electron transfer subunit